MRGGGAAKLGGQGGISAASGGMAPQSARPDRLPAVWEQQQATDSVTDLETQAVTDEQNQSAAQTQQSPTLKAVNPPANARYGAARAEIRGKINAGSASATHWTISPAGRLLRMTGGSPGPWMMSSKPETTPPAQWTEASVGRGVVFRAVAVVGANVWAGGSGKQFFYSRDDGIHWKRVTGRWQGDVTSIRFSDPRHGEMGTSAGERWVTVDGGEHWSEAGSAP